VAVSQRSPHIISNDIVRLCPAPPSLTKTDDEPTSLTPVGHDAGALSHENRPLIDTFIPSRYTRAIPPQLAAPVPGLCHRGGPPHG
jgi:hypothetical protein